MSQIKVLLAEDDKSLGMILKAFLDANGFITTLCPNGQEAWNAFNHAEFDFCITDIVMPVMDGYALAKQIKAISPSMPLVFLTAKKEHDDILEGFRVGADDYVTKPFSMDELLARLKAIHRRSMHIQVQPSFFQLGQFSFNALRHELIKGDEVQKLTSKESDLLLLLCENMGNTLERSKALQQIWKEDSYLNARSMDVYITKLRKYFKDDPNVDIQNVHGVGFKLVVK
jgi:DNA-binding response OmpR family regulator